MLLHDSKSIKNKEKYSKSTVNMNFFFRFVLVKEREYLMNFHIINNMDIEDSLQHLTTQFLNFSLTQTIHAPPKRLSNTLLALEMESEINPGHIDQYNILYLNRLKMMGARIPLPKVIKIQEVQQQLGTVSIIGIFKRIEFKRVRAFEKKFDQYYGNLQNIYHEKDTLELEDSSGKIKFSLKPNATMNCISIKSTDLPYGIIIGLTGKNNDEKMQFMVEKITLPSLPPQKAINSFVNNSEIYNSKKSQKRKSLFLSLPTVSFLQFVLNHICKNNFQIYCDIQSVVVMGFSKKLAIGDFRELDKICQFYGEYIDIHVMPNDSLGQIYPQKPLHPILLSKSYKKISLINNPQIFNPSIPSSPASSPEAAQTQILVSCGENVKDLLKNSSLTSNSLQCIESLLLYSHMAPTCPFSLKCEMMQQDYLIMKEIPHVFIVGDCQENGVKHWQKDGKKCTIVAIKQGGAFVLDIDSLDVESLDILGAGALDYN